MDYEQFNEFCKALPATTYVMQWNNSHVWKVGGKVFAIGGWGPDDEPACIFKASNQNYDFLKDAPGYRPAPYFASRGMKWIQCTDTQLDIEELKYYLVQSHKIVSLGLTKKKQAELGLNQ